MSEHSLQKPRTLKVQDIGDYFRKEVKPQIRLTGKWLLAAGLKPETHVRITNPQPGMLIVKSLEIFD
jgi:hypothetical protein